MWRLYRRTPLDQPINTTAEQQAAARCKISWKQYLRLKSQHPKLWAKWAVKREQARIHGWPSQPPQLRRYRKNTAPQERRTEKKMFATALHTRGLPRWMKEISPSLRTSVPPWFTQREPGSLREPDGPRPRPGVGARGPRYSKGMRQIQGCESGRQFGAFAIRSQRRGHVAELADALDLGSNGEIRAGSTPVVPTIFPLYFLPHLPSSPDSVLLAPASPRPLR